MFSISKFLGHDEIFFDLLEASALQADRSVHQLIDLLEKLERKDSTHDLAGFAARSQSLGTCSVEHQRHL